jgi:hypothetical protein
MRDLSSARRWLEQFKTSVGTMFALRDQLARELGGSWRLSRATDDTIIQEAAYLLSAGRWHVHASRPSALRVEAGKSRSAAVTGATPSPVPDAKAAGRLAGSGDDQKAAGKFTWIEICLLDEDDQPVTGEAFEIRFPDGSISRGKLGARGNARFAGIDPGLCEVRFPDIEASEWKRLAGA